MIQRVFQQAKKSQLDGVVVATDDARIFEHVLGFGGQAVMTATSHATGTDRCAEVAQMPGFSHFDHIVNVQGDEPFIQPEQINSVLDMLRKNQDFAVATLAKKISSTAILFNPNTIKAVFSQHGRALYFSRSPVPFVRGVGEADWLGNAPFFKHIGMYAFRRETLLQLAQLPQSPLEKAESLEQLRWMENGFAIGIATTEYDTKGIDSPEDLQEVLAELALITNNPQ
jgi:3-deoxy-manno-octulosonate cytidylyltransferase (CMP-KDO synthetase)